MARLIWALDGQLAASDGDRRFGEVVTEAHSFSHGDVLAQAAGSPSHVLASNQDVTRPAVAFCYNPTGSITQYAAIYLPQLIEWTGHLLGVRDTGEELLWLGGPGAFVQAATPPVGAAVRLTQRLGWIIDEDNILWKPEWFATR